MKCRYSHCKLGGEVDKEIAIKDGSQYFHKECYDKRENKRASAKILINDFGFMSKQVNMVLKKIIDDNNAPSEYVLWMANKIKNEKMVINNPFGLNYYLKEGRNWKEFSKLKAKEEYKNLMKEDFKIELEKNTEFAYKEREVGFIDIFKFKK